MLSAQVSTEQILELLYVIGAYLALAGILNTGNVPVEDEVLERATALGLPMLGED